MARLPAGFGPAALAAALVWALPARATEAYGECPATNPAAPVTLDQEVSSISGAAAREGAGNASGLPEFVQAGSDTTPVSTTWNIAASLQSQGKLGVAPTVAWTPDEVRQMTALIGNIPPCVRALANVQQVFRIQRTASGAVTGVPTAAFGLDNSVMFHPKIRLVISNTLLDRALYAGKLDANRQYQAVTAYTDSCQPPDHGLNPGNVEAAVAGAPPEIQALTVGRALYHEYLHGVITMLEDTDRLNPLSVEGFLSLPDSPSRWNALHQKLYGETPEAEVLAGFDTQLRAIPNDLAHRASRCALWLRRAEFLKSQGVPARWAGDTHALDDEEEYLAILLEQAIFTPQAVFGPTSPYSQGEQEWVKGFWQETFGGPVGTCGATVAQQ